MNRFMYCASILASMAYGKSETPLSDKLGPFDAINQENHRDFFGLKNEGIDLVYFGGTPEDYEVAKDAVISIAKELEGTYKFTWMDTVTQLPQAEGYMRTKIFPSMMVKVEPQGSYLIDSIDFSKADNIRQWLEDIKAGKLEILLQSEALPESNEETVVTVVGKNYKEVVNDKEDVFIKFYAPWCKHCKTLAPIYEELAVKMQTLSPKTVIAKMNKFENEFPHEDYDHYDTRSFPSLYFKPAGKNPIRFSGDRTVEAMVEFIAEEGTNKMAKLEDIEDEL